MINKLKRYLYQYSYIKRIFIISLIILIININKTSSQINPSNNAKLNYTQVMFEYPEVKGANTYQVQIKEISSPTISFSNKSIILITTIVFNITSLNPFLIIFEWLFYINNIKQYIEQTDNTTATLVNGLKFGKKYQWRYIALNKEGNKIFTSKLYYFETLFSVLVDKKFHRCKVNYKKINDGLIFFDGSKVAINRDGEPVWFLPEKFNKPLENIELNNSGTITFLLNSRTRFDEDAIDISLNGNILWKNPPKSVISGDSTENCHHNFKKLDNGNYMTIGCKYINPKQDVNADYIIFGTIIEYDSNNNVVWSWDSQKYFADSEIYYPPDKINSMFYDKFKQYRIYNPLHINTFYYDEQNEIIYISSRHKSRIIKFDKKADKIIAHIEDTSNLFKYQHAPLLLPNGNIAVFNNNTMGGGGEPNNSSIVIFTQPDKNNKSKLIWKFMCNFDKLYGGYSTSRGNISYIDNSNFLVNMGLPISRIFEVTKEKEIVWDCYIEMFLIDKNKWFTSCGGRASYTKTLYPVYFTLTNTFNSNAFNINNEGCNSDKYIIKYIVDNKEIKTIKTGEILPNKTKTIILNLKSLKVNSKNISIIVSSHANPDFKKELNFQVK